MDVSCIMHGGWYVVDQGTIDLILSVILILIYTSEFVQDPR